MYTQSRVSTHAVRSESTTGVWHEVYSAGGGWVAATATVPGSLGAALRGVRTSGRWALFLLLFRHGTCQLVLVALLVLVLVLHVALLERPILRRVRLRHRMHTIMQRNAMQYSVHTVQRTLYITSDSDTERSDSAAGASIAPQLTNVVSSNYEY